MRYIHVGFQQPKINLIFREVKKPGPAGFHSNRCYFSRLGIAAWACGLVDLEPTRVVEILKDRPIYFAIEGLWVFSMCCLLLTVEP